LSIQENLVDREAERDGICPNCGSEIDEGDTVYEADLYYDDPVCEICSEILSGVR
jgi:hypothetical protein